MAEAGGTGRLNEVAAKLRRPAKWTVGIVAAIAILGFLLLPPALRYFGARVLTDTLGRAVTIERVRVNPFALSMTASGVSVAEADGQGSALSFATLYANLEAESLLRGGPVLRELRLEGPRVRFARLASGRNNWSDVLERFAAKPPSEEEGEAHFSINNIRIIDGNVMFEDQPVELRHELSAINIGLPFLSNLPAKVELFVEPDLSALVNGRPLHVGGRTRPFAEDRETALDVVLDGFDFTPYLAYLPFEAAFKVPEGRLTTRLELAFSQPAEAAPKFAVKGTVELAGFKLQSANGDPLLSIPALALNLAEVEPLAGKWHVGRLEIVQSEVDLVRLANGKVNFQEIILRPASAPAAADKPQASDDAGTASPPLFILDEAKISGAILRFEDRAAPAPKGQTQPLVTLPRLTLAAVAISPAERAVKIGAVDSNGASLALLKTRDGRLDVLALLDEPAGAAKQAAQPPAMASAEAAAPEKPWTIALDRLTLDDWTVRVEDRTQAAPIVLQADAIKLTANGLGNKQGASTKFVLDAHINKKGRVAVNGTVAFDPLKGNLQLDLRSVDLLPLQPYVVEQLNIAISRGTVTTRGTLAFESARDGNVKGRFRGNLGIADFSSIDKNHATDFLRWRSLALAEVDVQTAPLAVSIGEVALTDFYTRLILDETGQLNLREIRQQLGAGPAAGETKPAPASSGGTTSVEVPPPATQPPPISIGKILIEQGNIAFSDRFIRPNYDANLTGMEGQLAGLSSDPATLARLDLQGKVDDTAPVTISGEFNPFRQDRYLNIAASVKDFELIGVSPYSSKYVGYGIEKGKLSADLTYKIEDRKLTATNRIFLDQLTFGNRADSPDAPNLPVQLAVSLLKNRAGEIDLNLPISGSLDDPQFSVGGLVIKAILNLIGKAITAPFALLGSMFGGGEELSQLDFAPGRSSFDEAAQRKVETLAKALTDRPALRLDITGQADREGDTAGLKKVILLRMMKGAKLKESVRRGDEAPPLEDVAIEAEEYPKWLERVYRDADFKRPRNAIGLLKELPEAEMEAMMLANIAVDDEALRHLAQERAQAVKSRLLEKGEIAANRVFLLAPKVEPAQAGEGGGRSAVFSLR